MLKWLTLICIRIVSDRALFQSARTLPLCCSLASFGSSTSGRHSEHGRGKGGERQSGFIFFPVYSLCIYLFISLCIFAFLPDSFSLGCWWTGRGPAQSHPCPPPSCLGRSRAEPSPQSCVREETERNLLNREGVRSRTSWQHSHCIALPFRVHQHALIPRSKEYPIGCSIIQALLHKRPERRRPSGLVQSGLAVINIHSS